MELALRKAFHILQFTSVHFAPTLWKLNGFCGGTLSVAILMSTNFRFVSCLVGVCYTVCFMFVSAFSFEGAAQFGGIFTFLCRSLFGEGGSFEATCCPVVVFRCGTPFLVGFKNVEGLRSTENLQVKSQSEFDKWGSVRCHVVKPQSRRPTPDLSVTLSDPVRLSCRPRWLLTAPEATLSHLNELNTFE